MHSSDKMQWAFMRMSGTSLLWFTDWCQDNFNADWTSFAIALVRRFGNSIERKAILGDTKKESEPLMVTGTIEGFVPEAMEKTNNGIIETNSSKIVLVPEKIVEIVVKKSEMVTGEYQRGKGTKEKFEAASETPRRKDRVVGSEQWLPSKMPTPPPEPRDSWPHAMVPPQRAPCLKSPFLGFSLCVDVFLTNPPSNPPDLGVSENDDGYKKGSLKRRRKEKATGSEPAPTTPVATSATTRE